MSIREIILVIIIFAAVYMVGCGDKKPSNSLPVSKRDTSFTTVIAAIDVTNNEYPSLTAMKIVYDTVMNVAVDSSGGEITYKRKSVRDSSYMIWYGWFVPDSTGKSKLKNFLKTADSVQFKFTPIARNMILHDWNKNWPVIK